MLASWWSRRFRLLFHAQPISRPRLHLLHFRRITDSHFDLMEPAFVPIVRTVGDHILTMELRADPLNGLFQPALPRKTILGSPRAFGEELDRVVFEDGLHILEQLHHERNEFGASAAADSVGLLHCRRS